MEIDTLTNEEGKVVTTFYVDVLPVPANIELELVEAKTFEQEWDRVKRSQ